MKIGRIVFDWLLKIARIVFDWLLKIARLVFDWFLTIVGIVFDSLSTWAVFTVGVGTASLWIWRFSAAPGPAAQDGDVFIASAVIVGDAMGRLFDNRATRFETPWKLLFLMNFVLLMVLFYAYGTAASPPGSVNPDQVLSTAKMIFGSSVVAAGAAVFFTEL